MRQHLLYRLLWLTPKLPKLKRRLKTLLLILGLLTLIALIWLPFGLKRPDRMEGWVLMDHLEQHNSPISQNLDGTGRPLLLLSWFVAHLLDANSFFGANVLLIALLAGKGAALYAILRRFNTPTFAFMTAALFVIYPSDTGVVDTRVLNIHSAIFGYLLAVYLFVTLWERTGLSRLIAVVGLWLLLTISLATYEIAYPLVALTPLLQLCLRRSTWQRIIAAGVWYVCPLFYGVYFLIAQRGTLPTYQGRLLQSGLSGLSSGQLLAGIVGAYRRNFWDGWLASIRSASSEYVGLCILAAVMICAVGWLCSRLGGSALQFAPRRRYLALTLIGLLIVALGFLPYIPTPLRTETWRVFLYASIGAALCVTAMAALVTSYLPASRLAFVALVSLLIAVGMRAAFDQQRQFAENSLAQQRILAAIITQAPKIKPNTLVLLLGDAGDWGTSQAFWANFYFDSAVRIAYADESLWARTCYPNAGMWGDWHDQCQFMDDRILISGGGFKGQTSVSYDKVIAFRYSSEYGAVLLRQLPSVYRPGIASAFYDPQKVVDFDSPLPLRAYTLFQSWPLVRPLLPQHALPMQSKSAWAPAGIRPKRPTGGPINGSTTTPRSS